MILIAKSAKTPKGNVDATKNNRILVESVASKLRVLSNFRPEGA